MKNKSQQSDDEMLRNILKEQLPRPLPSPWFTRKVLNRLPPRKVHVASIIEYLLYIIGIVVTSVVIVNYVDDISHAKALTVNMLTICALLSSFLAILLFMTVSPFLHRN